MGATHRNQVLVLSLVGVRKHFVHDCAPWPEINASGGGKGLEWLGSKHIKIHIFFTFF